MMKYAIYEKRMCPPDTDKKKLTYRLGRRDTVPIQQILRR